MENIELNEKIQNIDLNIGTPEIEINFNTGAQGIKGDTGDKGDKGDKGDTGATGPKGDSGVWVGETTPPNDYDVWINPVGTQGTIPTKTSELTNDSNFVSDASYVHTDNNFNSTYKGNVDANTTARHTHSNKSILDGISSTDVSNWHTHSNKTVIDGISATDITNWNNNTASTAVQTTEPTDNNIKLWVNPDTINGTIASNVIDSMSGNQTDKSPSVHATKAYIANEIQDVYSTSETLTNKVWIDNKPIYRKTITIPSFSTTTISVSTGLTTISEVVDLKGSFARNGYNRRYSIDNTYMAEWSIDLSTGSLSIATNNQYVEFSGYITIEYTKSS